MLYVCAHASVAKLVSAIRLGRIGRKPVGVRVPPLALQLRSFQHFQIRLLNFCHTFATAHRFRRRFRRRFRAAFGPHLPDATEPHAVVVELSAEKAHLVSSREWHASQTVTTLDDDRVRIAFVPPSLAPIVSWILEWGPRARAVAPTSLVVQVAAELRAAGAQYKANAARLR